MIEIIAHRGCGQDFTQPDAPPENTIPSFLEAWQQGILACEVDIQLTQDYEIIACHDPSTIRTTAADYLIRATPVDRILTLDAGSWKGSDWSHVRIPTLAQVLHTVPDHRHLYIDIKTGPVIVEWLVQVVLASGLDPGQIRFISFNLATLQTLKTRLPEYQAYSLIAFQPDPMTHHWTAAYCEPTSEQDFQWVRQDPLDIEALIHSTQVAGLDGFDVSYPMPAEWITAMQQHSLEWMVWTVDDPDVALMLAAQGISALTTNQPVWLRHVFSQAGYQV